MSSSVTEPSPLVLTLPEVDLPEGRRFWTDAEMFPVKIETDATGSEVEILPRPTFTVQETAKMFGKGADWLRWRARRRPAEGWPQGQFVLDGKVVEPRRNQAGHRYYTLDIIERMAHALVENGAMDGENLGPIVALCKNYALVYGYRFQEHT